MKKSLIELQDGELLRIGDVIVEYRDEGLYKYTVYKINAKMVSAYGQNMQMRKFPKSYSLNYKGHLCKSKAKVYRYSLK